MPSVTASRHDQRRTDPAKDPAAKTFPAGEKEMERMEES